MAVVICRKRVIPLSIVNTRNSWDTVSGSPGALIAARYVNSESAPVNLPMCTMCGGPLYRLYLSTKMGREPLALLGRRLVVVSLIAWLPLLILSAITGALIGGPVRVPFLYDIEVHIKYLLSLPLLIAAEMPVHRHLLSLKRMFVERGLISSEDRPRYERIFASATRLCYSGRVELLLLVVVYAIGHPLWIREIELPIATWYASPSAEGLRLTLPGYWYAFVSAPLLQFLFLRWYVRLFVWARLLWQVSRLNLHLIPAHPDRKGGLGFLEESVMAALSSIDTANINGIAARNSVVTIQLFMLLSS